MNLLDKWEAEASPLALLNDFNALRLLALIELVRKKDRVLELIESNDDAHRRGYSPELYARNALALTDNLRETK